MAFAQCGFPAELHVTEAGPRGGFMGQAPEDAETIGKCRRVLNADWGIGG